MALDVNYYLARHAGEESTVNQLSYAADQDLAQPAALVWMALEGVPAEDRQRFMVALQAVCDEVGLPDDEI
jgi:hypothetical protein